MFVTNRSNLEDEKFESLKMLPRHKAHLLSNGQEIPTKMREVGVFGGCYRLGGRVYPCYPIPKPVSLLVDEAKKVISEEFGADTTFNTATLTYFASGEISEPLKEERLELLSSDVTVGFFFGAPRYITMLNKTSGVLEDVLLRNNDCFIMCPDYHKLFQQGFLYQHQPGESIVVMLRHLKMRK